MSVCESVVEGPSYDRKVTPCMLLCRQWKTHQFEYIPRSRDECAPSTVRSEFTGCGLCGVNLPIDITRCIVMVHHRRANGSDRRYGCSIIRDDEKCARKQYHIVENGKS